MGFQVSPKAASPSQPRSVLQTVEWPTVTVAVAIYAGWIAATVFHDRLPPLALAAVGGWLLAWHNSLQHEVIHGHPTPWRRVNVALASAPLSLWLPFGAYRRSHLAHHATEHLTDPVHDPESRYSSIEPGLSPGLGRTAVRLQETLLGRLLIGPVWDVLRFLPSEAFRMFRGDRQRVRLWAFHALRVALILIWLLVVCRMSVSEYLLSFIYPGAALSLIRSFAEHRADPDPARRVAVVEGAPLLGLLFLNNNLHAAHHDRPGLAWYELPAFYEAERQRLLHANGQLVYAGYFDVFRRYLFRSQHGSSAAGTPLAEAV
jgi:fatty acid desaturase